MCIYRKMGASLSIHSNQLSQTELIRVLTPRSRELTSILRSPSWGPQHWKKLKERRKGNQHLLVRFYGTDSVHPLHHAPDPLLRDQELDPEEDEWLDQSHSHSAWSPQIRSQHTFISTLPLPFILSLSFTDC